MERASTAAVAAVLVFSAAAAGVAEAQTLRGSTATMQRQNRVAQQHDFTFMKTSAQVRSFVSSGYLVELRGSANYELAAVSHPYARPALRLFVERLSEQYRSACGEKLVVTSLTRPVRQQPRNASDLSVHPAGMAVDLRISRRSSCVRWLEKTLLSLERQGVLDVTRERRPPHYHIALFPEPYTRYVTKVAGPSAVQVAAAGSRPASTSASQSAGATAKPAASKVAESKPAEPGPATVQVAAVQVAAAEPADDIADLEAELNEALDGASEEKRLVTANVASPVVEVETYRVTRGDSLWSIARRHNTTVDRLKDLNSLEDSRIIAGQVITVPAAALGADDS
ncbi:MAG: DUF5715 family protein [Longimicrobiales bacterium]